MEGSIQFVDALLADLGPNEHVERDGDDPSGEALDAYSQVVTTVARQVIPSVASLRVSRRSEIGRAHV